MLIYLLTMIVSSSNLNSMKLKQYIELVGDRASAQMFGLAESSIRSYRLGRRQPSPQKAAEIEKITKGKVSFKECFNLD